MKDNRPTNIALGSLLAYHFPLPAVTSILHRISGIAIFVMLPFLLCLLDSSLASEASFEKVKHSLDSWGVKLFLWLTLSGLFYHLIAGVKHLLMDVGIGEDLQSARTGSWIVLGLSGVAAIALGFWIG